METKRLFKRFLFIGVMLFTSHVGFSQGAIINLDTQYGGIMGYCVHYHIKGSSTWDCIEVCAEGETTCYLDNLSAETAYEVRVHAIFEENGQICYGSFGNTWEFHTPIAEAFDGDFVLSYVIYAEALGCYSSCEEAAQAEGMLSLWELLDALKEEDEEELLEE